MKKLLEILNVMIEWVLLKIYNDFRTWCGQNIPKGKKYPDRNQLKAYLEKSIGPYPIDNRG